MLFDFYTQYKGLSNFDLLKIVQRPGEYQPEAVAAAKKLLSERQVSAEEIEQVKEYYENIALAERQKTAKMSLYKANAADFFEPILKPTTDFTPGKWLKVLLIIISLQYLWTLYVNSIHIATFIKYILDCKKFGFDSKADGPLSYWACFVGRFDVAIFSELLMLVYVPFIFYLLYKRKRWGWILLFADNLFGFILTLSQVYIFFKYQAMHGGNGYSFLFQLLIKGLFVFFLQRNNVTAFFRINKGTRNVTTFVTAIIVIVFMLSLQLSF